MINLSSGSHVGGLKLHGGVLIRHILPGPCGKQSTRQPVGGAPLAGTNTSSSTKPRRVASSFPSASTSGKSTASPSTAIVSASFTISSSFQSPSTKATSSWMSSRSSASVQTVLLIRARLQSILSMFVSTHELALNLVLRSRRFSLIRPSSLVLIFQRTIHFVSVVLGTPTL